MCVCSAPRGCALCLAPPGTANINGNGNQRRLLPAPAPRRGDGGSCTLPRAKFLLAAASSPSALSPAQPARTHPAFLQKIHWGALKSPVRAL